VPDQDGSYNHEAIVNRTNADLANDLSNWQRSLSMIAKLRWRGAQARELARRQGDPRTGSEAARRRAMADQGIHLALAAIFAVVAEATVFRRRNHGHQESVRRGKGTLDHRRGDPARVALLCQPFVPLGSQALDLLAVPSDGRDFAHVAESHALVPGTALPAPQPVFPRYVEQSDTNA
jgi:methionyl-tRNA synthetase